MFLLSILNLSFTDVITLVITPASALTFGWVKYLETDKEKHKASVNADIERDRCKIEAEEVKFKAEAEKELVKIQAEIDKLRISKQAEVDRAKEESVGAVAIVKVLKEINQIQEEIKNLHDMQKNDQRNDLLVNEIIERLQDDMKRLMDTFFKNVNFK